MLRRLVSPTKTRARIYDRDGVADPRQPQSLRPRRRAALRPAAAERREAGHRRARLDRDPRAGSAAATCRSTASSARTTARAIRRSRRRCSGQNASMVRVNDRGEVIVSVAVPVQRFRAVRGALLLSTQGGDIDDMVEAERLADLQGVPRSPPASWWCCRSCSPAPSPARCGGSPSAPSACAAASARASRFPTSPAARDEIGASVRRAARHDQRALQPHRGDRELRRRRRARTEESADLAALGGRDAAARQDRRQPRAAARRHPARRASGSTG